MVFDNWKIKRRMRVVSIYIYPAMIGVGTIVDVDSDTTWVKFTGFLALFQRGSPVVLYAVGCNFLRITIFPHGCAVCFNWSYCYTRN